MDPVFDSSPGNANSHAPVGAPPPTGPGHASRPLWAAVGVLGVAVAALGGTLLWQNVHGSDSAAPVASASDVPAQSLTREDVLSEKTTTVASAEPVAPPTVIGPRSAPPVVTAPVTVPAAHGSGYTGSYAAPASQPVVARAPVCADCGRIEAVTPIRHAAPATGLGAVAGGVLGAVLGNQFGHGGGRTATTLLGAGGGAYLGNTVEKRSRTTTTYQVRVRMDNGTYRTFERTEPPPVGQPVTVEGHSFRLGQGQTYSTATTRDPRYQPVSEPEGVYSTSRY